MKVMALALMLDVEAKGGSDSHLKSEPRIKKTENFYKPAKEMTAKAASKIAGFYVAPDASENPLGIDGVDPSQDLSKGLEDSEVGHKKKLYFDIDENDCEEEEDSGSEEEFENED